MFATLMGYMFVSIAALFTLGLVPSIAPRFYPTSPGLLRRLMAPILFTFLGVVCFADMGFQTLILTVASGVPCIVAHRWNNRKLKKTV